MHSCSKKEKGGRRWGGMRLTGAGGRQGQEAHSCGGGHCG